jgi:hypothetical protein
LVIHIKENIWIEFCCIIYGFIVVANEALARMASLGLLPNMILYFMGSYRLHLAKATQILLLSSAASNFTPVVGAFIADSYLGRFLGVGLGSFVSFLVCLDIHFSSTLFLSYSIVFFLSLEFNEYAYDSVQLFPRYFCSTMIDCSFLSKLLFLGGGEVEIF